MLSVQELSANSTVLLKNEGGVLPLTAATKVAIIGLADQANALTHGGGSGQVRSTCSLLLAAFYRVSLSAC